MKKIFVLILIMVLAFSGCGGNKSLGASEEVITDTKILKMNITEVTSEKIAVEIVNESRCEVCYEESYFIEFKNDGEWHRLKPKNEAAFIEAAYVLEEESVCTWGDNMSRIYGKLPEGEYRLIKYFMIFESDNDPGEKCTLAVQFRIG